MMKRCWKRADRGFSELIYCLEKRARLFAAHATGYSPRQWDYTTTTYQFEACTWLIQGVLIQGFLVYGRFIRHENGYVGGREA